jgi:hypothetical protein
MKYADSAYRPLRDNKRMATIPGDDATRTTDAAPDPANAAPAPEPTTPGPGDDHSRSNQPPGGDDPESATTGDIGGQDAGAATNEAAGGGSASAETTVGSETSVSGVESVTVKTQPHAARLDALVADIRKRLKPGLPANVQTELAELLYLLPELRYVEHASFVPLAEVAAEALTTDPPNLDLATSLRTRIKKHLSRPLFEQIFRSPAPGVRLVVGLGALLAIATPAAVGCYQLLKLLNEKWAETLFGLDVNTVALVAFFGILGSAVSIMVRIDRFSASRDVDPLVLFFIGFFKPVIGGAFALFVYISIKGKLLPIEVPKGSENFMFAALAFISGFSERFATDVASQAERRVVSMKTNGSQDTDKA